MKPCIVMRSHNDMPLVAETLAALHRFSPKTDFELIVFDNESRDGTRNEIANYTQRITTVPEGSYVPGRVLNEAMESSEGDVVVFLNADCTPQHPEWLSNLLGEFDDPLVAAAFGRQVPRPDCHPLFAKDTEDTYGDGTRQRFWRHCFSMACSAIRRSVWEAMRFSEGIQYSEDIDWTWRARQKGFKISYIRDAVVMHSHNYTLSQLYRRHFGEGKAEALIFDWSKWQRSLVRYSLAPYARQVVSDLRFCVKLGRPGAAFQSPVIRMVQLMGRRAGFRSGWKTRIEMDTVISQSR